MTKKFSRILIVAMLIFSLLNVSAAAAAGDTWVAVSTGNQHTMAIRSDGSLWAWGNNASGQLGDGTLVSKNQPEKIMDDVAFVSAGSAYTMAIKTDGSLWAWGSNLYGVLGDGSVTETGLNKPDAVIQDNDKPSPEKIMDNVAYVAAGSSHTAAIKTDGSLWTWGDNMYGELGDGSYTETKNHFDEHNNYVINVLKNNDKYTPVKVMDSVSAVGVGYGFTAALKTDGSVWTWGTNTYGTLGNGQFVTGKLADGPTPAKIMTDVADISANSNNVRAVKTDGSLWAWGDDQRTPVKMMDDASDVASGYYNTMAIKKDGSLWGWGSGTEGSLGVGAYDNRKAPAKIMDGIKCVSAGLNYAAAITADGTLYTWGANTYGQLGNGTTTGSPLPLKITLPAAAAAPAPAVTAKPASSTVLVNSKPVVFDAYMINDNNYFKLRDLAYVLNGTGKQFEINWDASKNAITLTSGKPYTADGSEMKPKGAGAKTPVPSSAQVYLDNKAVSFTAYTIDQNNYFKLRDIAKALNFNVSWDGASQTLSIDTSNGYTP